MRAIYITFKTFLLLLAVSSFLLAQAGSVELKDGGGVFISSHASIQEAYNAIPASVTQAYIIELLPAYTAVSETYPITLGLKSGTSLTNTITIRPAAGATGKVITATAAGTPILLISDADYVILDGRPGGTGTSLELTFENLATTSGSFTLRFLDGATNNIVRYCKIINNTMTTAGPRAIEIGTSAANPSGNSDILIEYNEIIGGRSCIGLAGTASNPNNNIQILNNRIYNFGYAGIWVLSSSNNILIQENEIFQTIGFNTANFGIIAAGFTALDVIKNKIYDIQNTTSTSVRGMQITPAVGGVLNVINNFVSLTQDNGTKTTVYGINILGSNEHIANIYYNTVRIGGNHSGGTAPNVVSGGIVKGNTSATSVFNQKNNIVLNNRTGGPAGVVHTGYFSSGTSNVGTQDIDYNVYFVSDAAASHAGWGGVIFSDLALYKAAAAPNEQNTIFKSVNFLSNTDLHLVGSSVGDLDLAGTPISGIVDDIDGDLRHLTYPYRGADEGDIPLPIELSGFTASVAGNSVTIKWSTASELNNSGFDIERKSENIDWFKIGFVPGNGTTSEIKNYSFVDNNLNVGSYNYRLKQVDHSGTYLYYMLDETVEISVPKIFELAQNYPNPFNPATNIKYSISRESNVKLMVYNCIGQQVALLVNENQQPGNYTINFDASRMSSGVYYYKIVAGDFVSLKKMILIK